MSEPFVGEIRVFPFGFAPRGWAPCEGQLLSISSNTVLFSIVGTTYGGDGRVTFALPDLRGAAPVHAGQGEGLSIRTLGETGGEAAVTLTSSEMPSHNHAAACSPDAGRETGLGDANVWADAGGGRGEKVYASSGGATMASGALGAAGGNSPHNNMPPYLTVFYCIALQGIYPRRPEP